MKVCILMGSMRKAGNTATLLEPFIDQLKSQKINYEYVWLKEYKLEPCRGCFKCQNIENMTGCCIKDEMNEIYKIMLDSDCIVFASPIYTWFCTVPMKLVLDRLFCMNKYYGNTKTNYSLLKNKTYAVVSTYGNDIETGPDLFEKAIKRLSEHSSVKYLGMLASRDINGIEDFEEIDVINKSKSFAQSICNDFKSV